MVEDKTTKIRIHSRRRSYGKKRKHRQLTGRKQRAIEQARVREVKAVEPLQEAKPIENVTPTETKIPWRAPRSKPDPGTYACRTITSGIIGCITLPCAIIAFYIDPFVGLYFSIIPIAAVIAAIQDLKKSRGGW